MRMMYILLPGVIDIFTELQLVQSRCAPPKELYEALLQSMELTTTSNIFIHFDDVIDEDLINLSSAISMRGFTTMRFYLNDSANHLERIMKTTIATKNLDSFRTLFNFIVLCQSDCVQQTLDKITQIDQEFGRRSLLRHFSKWLFISKHQNASRLILETTLDNVAIVDAVEPDQEYGEPSPKTCFTLWTLMWDTKGRSLRKVHDWLPAACEEEEWRFDNMFPNTRNGLNGRNLTIGVVQWTPFCRIVHVDGIVVYDQLCRELFNMLGHMLNFSYHFVEPPDGAFGYLNNKSWTGLLGMAVGDEIDLAGIPFGATLERTRVLTFSSIIGADNIQVAYRKTAYSNEWLFLLKCFSWEVYIWGLGIFLGVVIFYTNLELACWKRHNMKLTPAKMDVIQAPLAVALNQGAPHLPTSSSGRILLGSWRIVCLIIIAVYIGNQTAFSTVKKNHVPFSNLQELAENNEYKILMTKSLYLEPILQMSNDSVLKKIWSRIVDSRRPGLDIALEELQWHTDLLLSGKYAFIEYETIFDAISANSANVERMKHSIISVLLRYPFPLHSPLAELFSSKLTVLYEHGVIQEMLKMFKPKAKLETSDDTGQMQLTFANMKAAVVVCVVSIGISCMILAFEWILKRSTVSSPLCRF